MVESHGRRLNAMDNYEYSSVPKLARRIVDMANADIIGYHKNRRSFDSVFAGVMLAAQERVHLELLKEANPGERVSDRWWRFGFVPKDCTTFDDNLDAERLLVERNKLRAQKEYAKADEIRKRLESWGYEIGDEPGGTNWIVVV
jgi:cysteinyl-tRNA synthetase